MGKSSTAKNKRKGLTAQEKIVRKEVKYIKTFQPPNDPYYLCYSGGKDSDTIRILADLIRARI